MEILKPFTQKGMMGKVYAFGVGSFQCDLMDMSLYSKENKGYGYGLVIIDIHSRYGWCYPLKEKGDTYKGLEKWIVDIDGRGSKMFSDDGREFLGKFSKILKENGIVQVKVNSLITHQVMVERFIRTLKEKIRSVWYDNGNLNWVSHIDGILKEYNSTIHSRTGRTPMEIWKGEKKSLEKIPSNNEDDRIMSGTWVRYLRDRNELKDKLSLVSIWSEKRHKVVSSEGNNYLLDNGKVYPRWKLLISKEVDRKPLEKKKVVLKERRRSVKNVRKTLNLKNRKQAEKVYKVVRNLDFNVEDIVKEKERRVVKKNRRYD